MKRAFNKALSLFLAAAVVALVVVPGFVSTAFATDLPDKFSANDYNKLFEFAQQDDNLSKLGWDLDDPLSWTGVNWMQFPDDGNPIVGGVTLGDSGSDIYKAHSIYIGYKDLTGELDISDFTELVTVNCDGNDLTSINTNGAAVLQTLGCNSNLLTTIDVSSNTALLNLSCEWNQISDIDVSNNTDLLGLCASGNLLTDIDISNNTKLIGLYCENNSLTSLDLSNNPNLKILLCSWNNLGSLDLSAHEDLMILWCQGIGLTSLDLSNNINLLSLMCGSNPFGSLNLSSNVKLVLLDCTYNQLTDLPAGLENLPDLCNVNLNYNNIDVTSASVVAALETISDTIASNENNLPENVVLDNFNGFGSGGNFNDITIYLAECFLRYEQYFNGIILDTSGGTDNEPVSASINIGYALSIAGLGDRFSDVAGIKFNLNKIDADKKIYANVITSADTKIGPDWEVQSFDSDKESQQLLDTVKAANFNGSDIQFIRNEAFGDPVATDAWGAQFILETFKNDDNASFSLWSFDLLDVKGNVIGWFSVTGDSVSEWGYLTDIYYNNPNSAENYDSYEYQKLVDFAMQGDNLEKLGWDLDHPNTWAGVYTFWDFNSEAPQKLNGININGLGLEGSLDLSGFTKLAWVNCYENNLTSFNINNSPNVDYINCSYNQLTSLDVSNSPVLNWLSCNNNNLSALNVSNTPSLTGLGCDNNQLTTLDISSCTALANLWCHYNLLTELDVSGNAALIELVCDNNQLTSLDISNCTALEGIFCNYNQLTELDISANPALTNITCYDNELTSLDISNNPDLYGIYYGSNKIAELDVSNNAKLQYIWGDNNLLTELDVSNNPEILYINCSDNRLVSINLNNANKLEELICNNNRLTRLDLSDNVALRDLNCGANLLTALDVSKNTVLGGLGCWDNKLTSLDLSKNPMLNYLGCQQNKITALNTSNLTELNHLSIWANKIDNLDLSKNIKLDFLFMGGNPIKTLDTSKNPLLGWISSWDTEFSDLSAFTELENLLFLDVNYNNLDLDDAETINDINKIQDTIDGNIAMGKEGYEDWRGFIYDPQKTYMESTPDVQEMTFDKAGNYKLNNETFSGNFIITANGVTISDFTLNGNVIIKAKGATLKNATVNGEIVIDKEVGSDADSNAYLNLVKTNKVVVNGGGSESIHFTDSDIGEVVVNKEDNSTPVRIVAEGDTVIIKTTVESAVKLENNSDSSNGFGNVALVKDIPAGSTVVLTGSFKEIIVEAPGITIEVEGTVETMTVSQSAENLSLEGNGSIINAIINDEVKDSLNTGDVKIDNTETSYTVTFNTNGGSAVSAVEVTDGELLTVPLNPAKSGFTFGGWYKDSSFAASWDFAQDTVTGNITLYAKWTADNDNPALPGYIYTLPALDKVSKALDSEKEAKEDNDGDNNNEVNDNTSKNTRDKDNVTDKSEVTNDNVNASSGGDLGNADISNDNSGEGERNPATGIAVSGGAVIIAGIVSLISRKKKK